MLTLSSRPPCLFKTILLAAFFLSLIACSSNKSAPSSTASTQHATNNASSNTVTAATSSAQGNLPDPCTLITKAEAEEILGEPVGDPEPNSLGANRICDFKTVKVHGGVLPYSIHIAITPEKQNVWDAGKKLHSDAKELRPAPGFGDDAYFLLDDLEVLSKEHAVNINVMKAVDQPNHAKVVEAAEKAVAQKALPRLQ